MSAPTQHGDAVARGTTTRDMHNHLLFEIATEVANRVGGIYSVLKSKAPVTTLEYGDRYTLIGPLNRRSAAVEVEEIEPTSPEIKATIDSMKERGVDIVYGRWLVEGAPRVILIDTSTGYKWLDEWKRDLWDVAGIPSPPDDHETNEAIVFGYLVAWFLGEFARKIDVTTVFTTHATILGRYLCAGSVDFYNHLQWFDVDHEAGKRGIYHRYCIERASAHSSDVFTTVSHITAYESEHLLKRKPDGVLPNGLNVTKFAAAHEFQNLHQASKEKLHDFVRGHFYGHLDFDLDNTLYFFTAGRYEFRNKGVDMFIESLARLNHRLKAAGSNLTVVAFIIMPAQTTHLTAESLKGQAVIKSLREAVSVIERNIGKRLRLFSMKRSALPPIVTHNMVNDHEDPILNQLRRVKLFNDREDRVKVVFHPEFLNSSNPPWGYTPAECTVMGVPSITTNLSGFGCYMEELLDCGPEYGIFIVDRRMKGVDDSVNQMTDFMFEYCLKSRRERINQRNRTERLSDLLDWRRMGLEYSKARQLALRRAYPNEFSEDDVVWDWVPGVKQKIGRPFSVPGSPEGREGLSTEDYIAWKLQDEHEDEYDHDFSVAVRPKPSGPASPVDTPKVNAVDDHND
ncbi:unnamed protein product [Parascedosporium putredinis]|uniref:Glycogen [starch] synthase n=1 Tax=Parascedosporium putredinis TaxID=1442378 RepID=A0A9P1H0K8_9PEZI|nr:unnamed protein product [Parascedosporium putredinis]CAI7992890.1 unnamed protein product [Parascedosporium putredinis]